MRRILWRTCEVALGAVVACTGEIVALFAGDGWMRLPAVGGGVIVVVCGTRMECPGFPQTRRVATLYGSLAALVIAGMVLLAWLGSPPVDSGPTPLW